MTIRNNKVKFDTKRQKRFKELVNPILWLITLCAATVLWGVILIALGNEKMEDDKVLRIKNMADTYSSDYTKALELDDVTITKGEDIVVVIETENYKNTSRFLVDGTLVECKTEAKASFSDVFVSIFAAIFCGSVIYVILYIPVGIVSSKLEKKDNAEKEIIKTIADYLWDLDLYKGKVFIDEENYDKTKKEYDAYLESVGLGGIVITKNDLEN